MKMTYTHEGRVVCIAVDGRPWGVAEMTGKPFEWEFRQQTRNGLDVVCTTQFVGSVEDMINGMLRSQALRPKRRMPTRRPQRPVTSTQCGPVERRFKAVTASRVDGVEVLRTERVTFSSGVQAGQVNSKMEKLFLADGRELYGCTAPLCLFTAASIQGMTMHYRQHEREKASNPVVAVETVSAPVLEAPVEPAVEAEPATEPETASLPIAETPAGLSVMDMTIAELMAHVEKTQQAANLLDEWRNRALAAEARLDQLREIFGRN